MTQQNGITTSVLDDKVALVSISIGMFGGYRRATAEMISNLGGRLAASSVITEGSIKIFPNDPLKVFSTNRRRLFREIAAKGVKALGSSNVFAIPKTALPEVEQKISDALLSHNGAKADLDKNYDKWFEDHVKNHPEAAQIIRSLKVDKVAAIAKLHFSSSVFSIRPLVREGEDAEKGVQGIVAGLARQLFSEVASDMDDLLKSDSIVRGKAGQKTLRPLKAAVAKMQGLDFVDPRTVGGCVSLINQVLATLPRDGYIEDKGADTPFSTLRKLVETLADEDALVDAASRVANGKTAEEVLFPKPVFVPVAVQPPAPTAQVAPTQPALPAAVVAVSAVPSTLPKAPVSGIKLPPPICGVKNIARPPLVARLF